MHLRPSNADTTSEVRIEVITLPGDLARYHLVAAFLRMRKKVFVDQKAWRLHHAEDIEFEQYDTFDTTYVIAHQDGQVVGGARLKRTDRSHGWGSVVYSYMIRDAYLGLLPGLPQDLCSNNPPMDDRTWELTRLIADPTLGIVEAILEVANAYLFAVGAGKCLFLGSPAFMRMASRLGWSPMRLGEVVQNESGRFIAFGCDVITPAEARASKTRDSDKVRQS